MIDLGGEFVFCYQVYLGYSGIIAYPAVIKHLHSHFKKTDDFVLFQKYNL